MPASDLLGMVGRPPEARCLLHIPARLPTRLPTRLPASLPACCAHGSACCRRGHPSTAHCCGQLFPSWSAHRRLFRRYREMAAPSCAACLVRGCSQPPRPACPVPPACRRAPRWPLPACCCGPPTPPLQTSCWQRRRSCTAGAQMCQVGASRPLSASNPKFDGFKGLDVGKACCCGAAHPLGGLPVTASCLVPVWLPWRVATPPRPPLLPTIPSNPGERYSSTLQPWAHRWLLRLPARKAKQRTTRLACSSSIHTHAPCTPSLLPPQADTPPATPDTGRTSVSGPADATSR